MLCTIRHLQTISKQLMLALSNYGLALRGIGVAEETTMRSLGIVGAFVTLAVLVSLLLDRWTNKLPSELDIILISRFLVVTIGTCSALLSTVQAPATPGRTSRVALSSRRQIRRYTHDMFAASLMRDLNATFSPGVSRHGATSAGIRRVLNRYRCTRIPSMDWSRRLKERSVDRVCLRRGHN